MKSTTQRLSPSPLRRFAAIWRQLRQTNLVPNGACLICRQNSAVLVCEFCQQDIRVIEWRDWQHNLFHHPQIWPSLVVDLQHLVDEEKVTRLVALAPYRPPFKQLVTGLKFNRKLVNAAAMAQLFASQLQQCPPGASEATPHAVPEVIPQALLPMPLHRGRYYQRRFNQCQELCQQLSIRLDIPVVNGLVRHKATQTQSQLTRSKRIKNLANAFHCPQPLPYQRIAIVDDVLTTGATAAAACSELLRHQPEIRIELWCMCVTPAPEQNQT